jgi:hypothetical protein
MTFSQRFVVSKDHCVTDLHNPDSPKTYSFNDLPEDQTNLRGAVFFKRLNKLVDGLIINLKPDKTRLIGEDPKPFNEDAYQLSWAIWSAIRASRLYTLNPAVSLQNRFNGELKRQKHDLSGTSLGLFLDDIERLLRDLYGDTESEALQDLLRSISDIILVFTRYVRKDLWQEVEYARYWDLHASGNDAYHGAAAEALAETEVRVREVLKNPSAFSKYTVESAKGAAEAMRLADATGHNLTADP